MDTTEFLSSVWNADALGTLSNIHFIATPSEGKGMRHIPVPSVAAAVKVADKLTSEKRDVYFACGEYRSDKNRKGKNSIGACSFWLDIDCGQTKYEKGQGYLTQKKAVQALMGFYASLNLPKPSILVDSGYGVHVYWVLQELVSADLWRQSAGKLKALSSKLGLRTDPSRTGDIASVMRVPGTLNFKDPNEPKDVIVRFVNEG